MKMTSEIAQAIAKCVAYLNCGKPEEAQKWFRKLAALLGFSELLR
jgi:hypothetical protein